MVGGRFMVARLGRAGTRAPGDTGADHYNLIKRRSGRHRRKAEREAGAMGIMVPMRRDGSLAGSLLERRSGAAEGVFAEALCDDFVGLVYRIGAMEKIEVARADRAIFHQRVEINHLVPVLGAKQHDRHALACLARLDQRQDFEQLVERTEAAREQDDALAR